MGQCGPASSVANPTSASDRPLGNSVGAIGLPGTRRRPRPRCGVRVWGLPPDRAIITGPFGSAAKRGHLTGACPRVYDSYLVDSASSHMLVSKIKPCMSKYKQSIR